MASTTNLKIRLKMAIVKFSIGFAWPGCRTASGAVGRGGTRKCELGVKLRTGCKRRG